jgi:16S rRNA processing protein RimM
MQQDAFFYVGKIVRKFSFKGEVIIKVNSDYPEIISKSESVYITIGNSLVPFFMEKTNWQKQLQYRVKFEDVDTEADADAILNKKVFLPNSMLPKKTGKDFYKDEILDFNVVDVNFGNVGVVKGVNDKTPQLLLEVENEDGVVMIPVNDTFIIDIDRNNKLIKVETPEGLLDLRL